MRTWAVVLVGSLYGSSLTTIVPAVFGWGVALVLIALSAALIGAALYATRPLR